nr:SDR family NAD(P)-dependent oxidoreductase [Pseudofrankia sp. BMG5.36]
MPPIENWNRLLEGRVAVVTGGGDGIGGAIARLFAEHGALVEAAEIDPERAERLRAEVTDTGGTVRAHVLDVRVEQDVARLADAVLAEHGRVDVLVNNVGDYRPLTRFPPVVGRVVATDVRDQPAARLRRHARVHPVDDGAAPREHCQHALGGGDARIPG